MRITSNVHTHCTYCDGENTPQQVAERALALGFSDLGFSSHSPTPLAPGCPGVASEAEYRAGIAALKKEYAGRLTVLCGMEQDYFAPVNPADYDYLISSTHFFLAGEGRYAVADSAPERVVQMRNEWYGGNGIAMAEDFYAYSVRCAKEYPAEIVGHFDLITKFNADGRLFDEEDPRYRDIALSALDEVIDVVLQRDAMIEVNTGAISRGWRTLPYPAPFLLRHVAQRGARVIVTSDSHAACSLDCWFDKAVPHLLQAGFRSMAMLQNGRFANVSIG